MKTPILKTLTLILTLCALSASALNVLAQNKVVTGGATVMESDQTYESTASQAALQVSGSGSLYSGTNIILSATFNTGNGRYGAYAYNQSRIELYGGSITTTGSTGYGAQFTNTTTGLLSQVVIDTSGNGAHGIMMNAPAMATQSSSVELRDVSITTSGSAADGIHGVYSGGPVVRFTNLTVRTSGDGSSGLATEGGNVTAGTSFLGTGLRVVTTGRNGRGMQIYGGITDITDFVIQTYGDESLGVVRTNATNGRIYLTSGTVETSGSAASGFYFIGLASAETILTDVTIKTTGQDAHGVVISGGPHELLMFKGGSVTAEQGYAVRISGYNNHVITFQDGAAITGKVAVIDSGTKPDGSYDYGYTLNLTDSTLDGAITNLSSGTNGLTVNLAQSTATGDLTGSGTSLTVVNLDNSALIGDIAANDAAVITVSLDHESTGTGAFNGSRLLIGGDSAWHLTNHSAADRIDNHGVIRLGATDNYIALRSDTISGDGAWYFPVDSDTGAKSTVTGDTDPASHPSGKIIASGDGQRDPNTVANTLVTGDNKANWLWDNFSWGLDEYTQDGHDAAGNPHFTQLGTNPVGAVLSSAIAIQQSMWFAQQDSLLKRMGDLHYGAQASRLPAGETPALHNLIENIWLRSYGQQLNIGSQVAGQAYEQLIYGIDLGTDHKFTLNADNDLYLGVFAGYGRSDIDYRTPNTDGELNAYYGGLYATWLHSSGFYLDATIKAASVDNNLKAPYDNTQLTASYSDVNLGGSIEIGRKFTFQDGWFVEPQFQVNYLHILAENYQAGPMSITTSDLDALQLRLGSLFGRTIKLTNSGALQPYIKISGVETISTGGTLRNGYQSTRANTDGARAEVGGGLIWQLNADNQLHLDYEASFGDKYDKPWGLTAGYRHQF
ncbi:MAG: autotransporter outer membrane beta-barrel domain-containing protein [Verrucomicrobiales bacterium]|jgi:outer membrane autotransporter protein|nr:autotransporter outer membrane beta-barrel domain-containing protein [Verrucomicrobiales bacterium]